MRIDRLLGIITLLLRRDRVRAADLARRFEVSTRTIYRDIDALSAAGIPIVAHTGAQGGYSLMESYTWDRQLLRFGDIPFLLAALRGIGIVLDDEGASRALERLESVSRDSHEETIRAIVDRRALSITYVDAQGQTTQRTIEPLALVFRGFTWYLFGFCRLREEGRLFRVSAISRMSVLQEQFPRRATQSMIRESIRSRAPTSDFILRFRPEHKAALRDYFGSRNITTEDSAILVHVSLPDEPWVYRTLLSYGDGVEVLSPESARQKICDLARSIGEINAPILTDSCQEESASIRADNVQKGCGQ